MYEWEAFIIGIIEGVFNFVLKSFEILDCRCLSQPLLGNEQEQKKRYAEQKPSVAVKQKYKEPFTVGTPWEKNPSAPNDKALFK